MKKWMLKVLILSLVVFYSPIFSKQQVSAADASWVKDIEFDVSSFPLYILKSNGDLMLLNEGGDLKKLSGNVSEVSYGDELYVLKKDSTVYEYDYPNDDDLQKITDIPEEVGKIKSIHGGSYCLYIINEQNQLWFGDINSNYKKLMDNVKDIKTFSSSYSAYILDTDNQLWFAADSYRDFSAELVKANVSDYIVNNDSFLILTPDGKFTDTPRHDKNQTNIIMDNVSAISTGESYPRTYGILTKDSSLFMFGDNYYGQIGDDTTKDATYNEPFKTLDKVSQVYIGNQFTLAVRSNGEVWGWGGAIDKLTKKTSSYFVKTPIKILDPPNDKVSDSTGQYKNASDWALPELKLAQTAGLVVPVSNANFSSSITREKFAEVVIKYYEALTGETVGSAATNPFTDTKNKEVVKAYNLGLIKGVSDTKFSPNSYITREDICVMLQRALEKARPNANQEYQYKRFEDEAKFASYASEAVKTMRSLEIVKGDSNNNFNPKNKTSIEEAVIMTYRLFIKTN